MLSRIFFLLVMMFIATNVQAQLIINPSDDGSIYGNGSVDSSAYVLVSGSIQGVTEFPLASLQNDPIADATLSVNPYALPLFGPTVAVYGFGSTNGILTSSDYNAGTFLGNWDLPNLNYGEKGYFDVTNFLQTVNTPYVGFDFRTPLGDSDVFSSLEYNYGSPSQLDIDVVPELPTVILFGLGLMGVLFRKRILVF